MATAKPKLTEEQWKALGEEWCAGVSTNSLAKKYNIARPSIDKAAKRHGWSRDPLLQDAIAAAVSGKMQGMKHATDPATREAAANRIAGDRAELILRHQDKWADIYQLREDAFRLLRGEPTLILTKPLEKDIVDPATNRIIERKETLTLNRRITWAAKLIAMFEADARAMIAAQEGERRAWGFDYKTQQEGNAVNEQELRRRNELIDRIRQQGEQLAQIQSLQAMAGVHPAEPRPPSQPQTIDGEILPP